MWVEGRDGEDEVVGSTLPETTVRLHLKITGMEHVAKVLREMVAFTQMGGY